MIMGKPWGLSMILHFLNLHRIEKFLCRSQIGGPKDGESPRFSDKLILTWYWIRIWYLTHLQNFWTHFEVNVIVWDTSPSIILTPKFSKCHAWRYHKKGGNWLQSLSHFVEVILILDGQNRIWWGYISDIMGIWLLHIATTFW